MYQALKYFIGRKRASVRTASFNVRTSPQIEDRYYVGNLTSGMDRLPRCGQGKTSTHRNVLALMGAAGALTAARATGTL